MIIYFVRFLLRDAHTPRRAFVPRPSFAVPCPPFAQPPRSEKDQLEEVDRSPSASTMKNQVVGLIAAAAYLRGPLIVLNTLTCIAALFP